MSNSNWQWLAGVILGAYLLARIGYLVYKHRGEGYWTQTISQRNRVFWLVSSVVIACLLAVIVLVLRQAFQPGR